MTITLNPTFLCSVIGMPKEKYDPPDPRRMYTIMSSEEAANGKKSYWAELEISGQCLLHACVVAFFCVWESISRQILEVEFYCWLESCYFVLDVVLIGQFRHAKEEHTLLFVIKSFTNQFCLHSAGSQYQKQQDPTTTTTFFFLSVSISTVPLLHILSYCLWFGNGFVYLPIYEWI